MNLPPRGDEFRKFGLFEIGRVHAQLVPNMTVKINPIAFLVNGTTAVEYAGGTSPIITAPTANSKWVFICLNSLGIVKIIEGVASIDPAVPAIPRNYLPLAVLFIRSTTTAITEDMVFDFRPLIELRTQLVLHNELTNRTDINCHSIEAITGLETALTNKASVEDLQGLLNGKAEVTGTNETEFTIGMGVTGTPASDLFLKFNRGNEGWVGIKWDEATEKFSFSYDGGVTWYELITEINSASVTTAGFTKLSIAPVSDPIAVGDNDPRLLSETQKTDLLQMQTDIVTTINDTVDAKKNVANGLAPLDSDKLLPSVNLPYHGHLRADVSDFSHEHVKAEISDFTHNHTKSDVTDFTHNHTKSDVTDFSHGHVKADVSDFTHTHTQSDVTDFAHGHLKAEISDFSHGHVKADVSDFTHNHTKSEVTDFAHEHLKAEISDFTHTHTKSDVSDFSHGHVKADVSDFAHEHVKAEISDFTHTHVKADVSDFAHAHVKSEISDFAHTHTPNSGDTSSRPTTSETGLMYFDITLGKPIWWNGSAWVDATGTTV